MVYTGAMLPFLCKSGAAGIAYNHVGSNIVRPLPFSIASLLAIVLRTVNPPLGLAYFISSRYIFAADLVYLSNAIMATEIHLSMSTLHRNCV